MNHPGIATLHGFFESDGVRFLVMELVEGETLEARIEKRGDSLRRSAPSLCFRWPKPWKRRTTKGVIHRDLKPPNIKITPDGRPKILGLRIGEGPREHQNANVNPNVTHPSFAKASARQARALQRASFWGTAPYMSPRAGACKVPRQTDGHLVVLVVFCTKR